MKKLKKLLCVFICIVMLASICGCGTENAEPTVALSEEEKALYKPTSLTVTLYDAENSVYGFTFNTTKKPLKPVIQIKKADSEDWTEYAFTSEEFTSYTAKDGNYTFYITEGDETFTYYISKAEVPLDPNCSYTYRVYDKQAGIGTEEATLNTKDTKAKSFTFTNITDTQDSPMHFTVALSAVADKTDFLLHTGDIVEISMYEQQWTDMLDVNFQFLSGLPIMALAGNHDTYFGRGSHEIYKHFNYRIPQQSSTQEGQFYSFIYGNAKFLMVNTNGLTEDKKLPEEQYNWIVNELENNTCKWTIVALHNMLYSVGKYGANLEEKDTQITLSLREQLAGIFAKYGVDLVLQGHDHCVSRTYPINEEGIPQKETLTTIDGVEYSVDPKGVVYVMHGTTGHQVYSPFAVDETIFAYASDSKACSYADITVEEDKLTISAKYRDGLDDIEYYTWGIQKTDK